MSDTRPLPVRIAEVQQIIIKACKEHSLEIVPIIERTIQQDAAKVIYVDMNDEQQRKKFGFENQADKPSGLLTN